MAKPFGLQGFYGVKAMCSTIEGLDLRSIPDLILPPEAGAVPTTISDPYYVGASVQQYLWQDAKDPKRGWGLLRRARIFRRQSDAAALGGIFRLRGDGPAALPPRRSLGSSGVSEFIERLSGSRTEAVPGGAR